MAERWLVIDDSSTIQRVIKLAFQGYDVHITEADSCQEAAREMMASQPSLVIADAALGGVQGVQDFLSLKAQAPNAPFIILEGSYDNIDEAQFRAAGFRHFLKKPFDGSQLLSITRQALGRALPYRVKPPWQLPLEHRNPLPFPLLLPLRPRRCRRRRRPCAGRCLMRARFPPSQRSRASMWAYMIIGLRIPARRPSFRRRIRAWPRPSSRPSVLPLHRLRR